MPSDEARALATAILAHYPGEFIAEMNVLALADTLERIGMDIAAEVAERARHDLKKPPSSAALYAIAHEIREERNHLERSYELPAAVGVQMPLEVRQMVEEMTERWKVDEAELDVERELEWERVKEASRRARKRSDICQGTGKAPVERDGKRVCPDCGVEVPDILVSVPAKGEKHRKSWKTGEWS